MIFTDYIYWHYVIAPLGILGALKNYLIGIWHKFLIATHFKTLLAPWHRTKPSEIETTKNLSDKIVDAIIDFYIRIIAALARLSIILLGLFAEFVTIIVFIILLIIWLLWPLIFIKLIGQGLALVF
jgi:hypothetical protein